MKKYSKCLEKQFLEGYASLGLCVNLAHTSEDIIMGFVYLYAHAQTQKLYIGSGSYFYTMRGEWVTIAQSSTMSRSGSRIQKSCRMVFSTNCRVCALAETAYLKKFGLIVLYSVFILCIITSCTAALNALFDPSYCTTTAQLSSY